MEKVAPEPVGFSLLPPGSATLGPMTGPVLGLDLGTRRIGLALSDPEAAIAFPAGHLDRRGLEADLAALAALVEERRVTRIVVGLPLHLDGRGSPGAAAAEQFAEALARATARPVDLLDERWTSLEAERALREAPSPRGRRAAGERTRAAARRNRRRERVDATAATLLLRTYLARAAAGAAP